MKQRVSALDDPAAALGGHTVHCWAQAHATRCYSAPSLSLSLDPPSPFFCFSLGPMRPSVSVSPCRRNFEGNGSSHGPAFLRLSRFPRRTPRPFRRKDPQKSPAFFRIAVKGPHEFSPSVQTACEPSRVILMWGM